MSSQSRLSAPERVLALYNTDYDAELKAATGADVSAVEAAARAVARGVAEAGHQVELVGIDGYELGSLIDRLRAEPPDLVFNLCESLCGDARNELVLPALLDMLGVPYTGPGPLTLGMCLHKERAKQVLTAAGVPTPPYRMVQSAADLDAAALDELDYPYFLKPAHEDASVGIESSNVVRDAGELVRRASSMLERHRQPVVAERFIDGRELNVTLLGNGEALRVLPLHEIDFSKMPAGRPHIISYAAKWDEGHDEYAGTLPVPLRDADPGLERAIMEVAQRAFRALGLRDFGRIDLRIDGAGQPQVIDVNPNCDLSPDAGVARAAARAGASYPQLVGEVCEIAWRRHVGAGTTTRAG